MVVAGVEIVEADIIIETLVDQSGYRDSSIDSICPILCMTPSMVLGQNFYPEGARVISR